MSKLVWIAAGVLVLITVGLLWWADRSDEPPRRAATPVVPLLPMRPLDGGHLWRPHPDRAGLLRHRLTD
jgi:hypothetical protein